MLCFSDLYFGPIYSDFGPYLVNIMQVSHDVIESGELQYLHSDYHFATEMKNLRPWE